MILIFRRASPHNLGQAANIIRFGFLPTGGLPPPEPEPEPTPQVIHDGGFGGQVFTGAWDRVFARKRKRWKRRVEQLEIQLLGPVPEKFLPNGRRLVNELNAVIRNEATSPEQVLVAQEIRGALESRLAEAEILRRRKEEEDDEESAIFLLLH